MNIIEKIENSSLKTDTPNFKSGDTVKVYQKIKEGDKERIQVYEGVVIARKGSGLRSAFTVRKNSYGVGVEKTFLVNSPLIDKIDLLYKGKVRRAKLYYLRKKKGKEAKIERLDMVQQQH
ncbi:MAG: 50S ribosomal protein L19 [bacterium]